LINLRYHIVSLTAVFLALGLGILLGSAVLSGALVDRLESDISSARDARNDAQERADEIAVERDLSNDLVAALAPRVTEGLLTGIQVLFVRTDQDADWHDAVQAAITGAGATNAGSIVLTSKWSLRNAADRDELRRLFAGRPLADRTPGSDALRVLGGLLGDDEGRVLIEGLAEAEFITTAPADEGGAFPPPGVHVVVLADAREAILSELARGAASVTPTIVVAGGVDTPGAVAVLRRLGDLPSRLATFDSADDDPTGVGAVLALRAAVDGQGDHFGRGDGLAFLPAPP
jgi:hypothetical protein